MTLVATCHQNGVNVRRYLEDVLQRIQDHPANRIRKRLPYHWTDPQAA
ncbi:transposase domain-containing protein [Halorhodospira sp. 9621]|nr:MULTISPECIES: transposase domain-containing protein [Halorhodospira]MCG5529083.1 transposase domain-containing protein [Halorhodospira halophila]MCG5534245.1 transposase domain-containing protein [Halorhodospira sp. 9621]MCG5543198.1 transposase domain-containing protein [Halorhodospira sp. 9628]